MPSASDFGSVAVQLTIKPEEAGCYLQIILILALNVSLGPKISIHIYNACQTICSYPPLFKQWHTLQLGLRDAKLVLEFMSQLSASKEQTGREVQLAKKQIYGTPAALISWIVYSMESVKHVW